MKYLLLVALLLYASCSNSATIWNKLRPIYSKAGTAAIMGNLQAESGLESAIYQNSYKGSVGLSDQEYVKRVNSGQYSEHKFVHDSVGFGLAQWTYYSRKQGLYNKCKGKIGDLNCQLNWLVQELATFSQLSNYLKSTTDLYEATSRVCKEYEMPAINNIGTRYNYALNWYNTYN